MEFDPKGNLVVNLPAGPRIQLNLYRLLASGGKTMIHHTVKVMNKDHTVPGAEEVPFKAHRVKAVEKTLQKNYSGFYAYDGRSNLYTFSLVNVTNFRVMRDGFVTIEKTTADVINFRNIFDFHSNKNANSYPYETEQALNVIFGTLREKVGYKAVSRAFFADSSTKICQQALKDTFSPIPRSIKSIWAGDSQRIIPTKKFGLLYNLNKVFTLCYDKEDLVTMLARLKGIPVEDLRRLNVREDDIELKQLWKDLRGIRINVNRSYIESAGGDGPGRGGFGQRGGDRGGRGFDRGRGGRGGRGGFGGPPGGAQSSTLKKAFIGLSRVSCNQFNLAYSSTRGVRLQGADDPDPAMNMHLTDYFRMKYNVDLKFPNLPAVQVAPEPKNLYFPMEFCSTDGPVRCQKGLLYKEQQALLDAASCPPHERLRMINDSRDNLDKTGLMNNPFFQSLGITLDAKMLSVDSKQCPAVSVRYQTADPEKTDDVILDTKQGENQGTWELRDVNFLKPASYNRVGLVCMNGCVKRDDAVKFMRIMNSQARARGMKLGKDADDPGFGLRVGSNGPNAGTQADEKEVYDKVMNEFNTAAAGGVRVELILIFRSDRDAKTYDAIKRLEKDLNKRQQPGTYEERQKNLVVTSCIMKANVEKVTLVKESSIDYSLLNLFLSKINVKLGGVNQGLADSASKQWGILGDKPWVIIGAD
eukprot:Platyproteum_vivax@DN5282_c0_g1_i2.p1